MDNSALPPSDEFLAKLQKDMDAMRVAYPQFKLSYNDEDCIYLWEGKVKLSNGKINTITVKFTCNYPARTPRSYVDIKFPRRGSGRFHGNSKRLPRPPHLYSSDDSLCLFYPEDTPERRWKPDDLIVDIVSSSIAWLEEYYIWIIPGRKHKKWPALEAPHIGPK